MLANIFYRLTLVLAFSFTSLSANADYAFNLLDSLGGTKSEAMGINASGQVVGYAYTANDANYFATLWNGTSATALTTLSGSNTVALGINSQGQVSGYTNSTPSPLGDSPLTLPYNALIWNNGNASNLPSIGGTYNKNNATNNAGTSVGWSLTSGDTAYHATAWTGLYTIDLGAGASGGTSSRAVAINNSGLVVGSSLTSDGNGYHATLWNGTIATDLGTLGGSYSIARAINDSGQIVGWSNLTDGSQHATLWNNGIATDLGLLGGFYSYANGINSSGKVVGWSSTASGVTHATMWDGTTAIDLNSFLSPSQVADGWVLDTARAINENGSIVGGAYNTLLGITSQAFILAAVPELNTNVMLLMGLGLFGFMARRQNQIGKLKKS